jgi:hypothetical protein
LQVRVLPGALNIIPAETRYLLPADVRPCGVFPRAQNGTCRFSLRKIWETRTIPRLAHAAPKYRKHRRSGQIAVSLSGRDHYLGPYGSKASKLEYDRLVRDWLDRDRNPEARDTHGLLIFELVARYWSYAKREYLRAGRPSRSDSKSRPPLSTKVQHP